MRLSKMHKDWYRVDVLGVTFFDYTTEAVLAKASAWLEKKLEKSNDK